MPPRFVNMKTSRDLIYGVAVVSQPPAAPLAKNIFLHALRPCLEQLESLKWPAMMCPHYIKLQTFVEIMMIL